jgi:pyrimidine-nucleoside phosphorylase
VCRELGAGRSRADQELDLSVGVTILKNVGDEIKQGEPWLKVHHSQKELDGALKNRLQESLKIVKTKPCLASRIIKIIE